MSFRKFGALAALAASAFMPSGYGGERYFPAPRQFFGTPKTEKQKRKRNIAKASRKRNRLAKSRNRKRKRFGFKH